MKTITLILAVTFFIGCSKYNLLSKNEELSHQQQKTQIVEKYQKADKHTGSAFKYTLSSFMPTKDTHSGTDGSWMEMLQDYMNSDSFYYIVSIISFIAIVLLLFIGSRNKDSFSKNKKRSA